MRKNQEKTEPVIAHRPLPMSRDEMELRGWDQLDIIIVTGDAYIDHPSFGAAIIGRWLEARGFRVGIIAQPDIRDVESLRQLGAPCICWGITAGNLDSQLSRTTIMKKPRSTDAYSPDGQPGLRPANATIVYANLARQAYPGVPVVLGGLEASLRRFPHYDFWTDKVKRSILFDAKANLLVFGMGERAMVEACTRLRDGEPCTGMRGTAVILPERPAGDHVVELPSFEAVGAATEAGKQAFAGMTRDIFHHLGQDETAVLAQRHGDRWLVVYPPAQPLAQGEMDALYRLPFTRRPHPRYGNAAFAAYDMIKDSITTHRGCYSGCSFCAIGAHQGTVISSRSEENILQEIARLARDPDFHGTISDLGGPTANMYRTGCKLGRARCKNRSCLYPTVCRNLRTDHGPVLSLLRKARKVPGVKHLFISSGIRFDLALEDGGEYIRELTKYHVAGRLKIAPEHVSPTVLCAMRKPGQPVYRRFIERFTECARQYRKPHQVVEYFISGHPGCRLADMIELACYLRKADINPEQVQDFYPAPLTLAAAMFYTGLDPLTGEAVYVPRTEREKILQRAVLLSHKPEFHRKAREALREAGREDLVGYGRDCLVPPEKGAPRPVAAPARKKRRK
ncbi:MAG: YgiQ family radical SAM protein [Armatimonadota bacterium]